MNQRGLFCGTILTGITGASWITDANAVLTFLVGLLTLAWWLRRWFGKPEAPPNPPKIMPRVLLAGLVCVLVPGCARFATVQKDYSYENGKLTRKIYTKAAAGTFFEAKSSLATWKASQTDKTQGASVGNLNQEATATNLAPVIEAVAEGVAKGLMKGAVPVPIP